MVKELKRNIDILFPLQLLLQHWNTETFDFLSAFIQRDCRTNGKILEKRSVSLRKQKWPGQISSVFPRSEKTIQCKIERFHCSNYKRRLLMEKSFSQLREAEAS
jgi:hypothetical protein